MRKYLLGALLGACVFGLGSLRAGSPAGLTIIEEIVQAKRTNELTRTFKANERAVLILQGDGDTDLDIEVYDDSGKLVASDLGLTDRAAVLWVPDRTQIFTVKIKNLGAVFNKYKLVSN